MMVAPREAGGNQVYGTRWKAAGSVILAAFVLACAWMGGVMPVSVVVVMLMFRVLFVLVEKKGCLQFSPRAWAVLQHCLRGGLFWISAGEDRSS